MNKIPPKLRKEMSEDDYYKACARQGIDCSGRITWEHALIFAGKQIQEKFAIIPLCEHHHLYGGMIKWINEYIALSRATDEELNRYSKAVNLFTKRNYLKHQYDSFIRENTK